ncbi:MAG: purine-nucleoside phosphorylase [Chitinophagia bacterium]|nr:purine-nucleoside phosphorylase [Chitinophagia bacterium]NCA29452.1 purine-nucleoside phosphorylase [Chitinophagia bacterium]
MSTPLMATLEQTAKFIQSKANATANTAIILGSGLGNLSQQITIDIAINYSEIPNFPISTVEGHKGRLILGTLNGVKVWVMEGRFHFYEGYAPSQVVFPIRVLHLLGVKNLLLSNAAGGVNPNFQVGDLMIINDHISLFTPNPLLGKNEEALGTRFPDMSEPYAHSFIEIAKKIAAQNHIKIFEGVYVGVTGPTFETRSEYKLIKIVGGDLVGMSTVQETIAAVHCGMKVFAVSVVTDLGIREDNNIITHHEVLEAAHAAEPKLTILFSALLKEIA